MAFEQDANDLPLGVLVIVAPSSRFDTLRVVEPWIHRALPEPGSRSLVRVHLDGRIERAELGERR